MGAVFKLPPPQTKSPRLGTFFCGGGVRKTLLKGVFYETPLKIMRIILFWVVVLKPPQKFQLLWILEGFFERLPPIKTPIKILVGFLREGWKDPP